MKYFLFSLFSFVCFAQGGNSQYLKKYDDKGKIQDEIERMFQQQRRMFDTLLKDNGEIDKQINKMFEKLRNRGAFGNLQNDMWSYRNSSITTYWKEDQDSKSFIIEADSKKDNVNIDIKNGLIKISGQKKIEKKIGKSKTFSSFTFQNTTSVPNDVDESSATFKTKKDKIIITFTKKNKMLKKKKPKYRKLKGKATI